MKSFFKTSICLLITAIGALTLTSCDTYRHSHQHGRHEYLHGDHNGHYKKKGDDKHKKHDRKRNKSKRHRHHD